MLERWFKRFFFSGLEKKRNQTTAFKNRISTLTNRIEQQMSDYDMLLNGVDTMIWLNHEPDIQGRSNQAVLDFFGVSQEDAEGKNLYEILPPEEAQIWIKNNEEVFNTGKAKITYEWVTRFDGEKRLLKITKRPKVNGKMYLISSAEDITESEEIKNKLHNECNFTENLIGTARALILVLNPDGHILRCNSYFEEITGYSFEEIENKNWFNIFIKETDKNRLKQILQNYIEFPDMNTFLNKRIINAIKTKDGKEILVEWYTKSLYNNLNTVIGVISVGQDITEKKLIEEELWSKVIELEIKLQQKDPQKASIFIKEENKGNETILLVEDEKVVLNALSLVLQQHGYLVFNALSAQEALKIKKELDDIDIVVADLYMPRMDGLELIAELKRTKPSLKYLIISGAKFSEDLKIQKEYFFSKPFLLDEFVQKVRNILDI